MQSKSCIGAALLSNMLERSLWCSETFRTSVKNHKMLTEFGAHICKTCPKLRRSGTCVAHCVGPEGDKLWVYQERIPSSGRSDTDALKRRLLDLTHLCRTFGARTLFIGYPQLVPFGSSAMGYTCATPPEFREWLEPPLVGYFLITGT